jgi:RNA polymerase sigma-70 factor (ECF subfamily)
MVNSQLKNNFNEQQKLIEACRNNSRKAQLKLYKQYNGAMYSVCLNMVSDKHLAEDLMQESFISAFQKLNSFKGEVSFGAWLKRITINKCIDYLKSKKIQFESIENLPLPAEISNEEEQIANEKSISEIKEKVKELPEGYKTILTLYLFEGYDHEEIGQILNISSSTSRSQYTRAKAHLIKLLNR